MVAPLCSGKLDFNQQQIAEGEPPTDSDLETQQNVRHRDLSVGSQVNQQWVYTFCKGLK